MRPIIDWAAVRKCELRSGLAVRRDDASILDAEHLCERRRMAVVVTLGEIDFELWKLFRDGCALDMLRDGQHAKRLSSLGKAPDQRFRMDVVDHAAHEAA